MRPKLAACWLAFFSVSTVLFCQEPSRTIKLSEVRPYLFALETLGADGRVCKVEIERRHWVEGRQLDLSSAIPEATVTSLIDELVPSKLRGPLLNPSLDRFGNTTVFGNLVERTTEYQNVKISVISDLGSSPEAAAKVILIDWKSRGC